MEMEKSHYWVRYRPEYVDLIRASSSGSPGAITDAEEAARASVVVAITQGGFGQDVVDDERQVKERFMEHLFFASGIDLPRSAESFDRYFELDSVDEYIDLDDER